ncbi:non-ribosomal peptide synthase/polyketide synthase [Streptomyces sp. NPDC055094]
MVSVFAGRVAESPGSVAVVCGGVSLTYGELDVRAGRLARVLVGCGVGVESRVGLLLERSVDVVVAMVAVVRAGGAYVPLHGSYPGGRVREVLGRSGAVVVVTDRAVDEVGGVPAVRVDAEPVGDVRLPLVVPSGALAYVMFTSGSSGVPKGVAVTHGDIVALAADSRWSSGAHGRVLFHSPHSFDAATYEVWVPLLNGGTVDVAGAGLSVSVVRDAVARGVSGLFLTKALFDVLAEEDAGCFAGLGEVWTGGEAASGVAMGRVLEACPGTELVHVYGPTESTTFAVCGPVTGTDTEGAAVPLGGPMDNTSAYVLDGALRPVGVGDSGELYLGGGGLARGYDGRSGLTAERFVADPFGSGERLYRTGDVVRWRSDSRLEFLGRDDGQVKVRGFRIELGEIESVLSRHASVGRVSVVVREDRPGVKSLVAYLVPSGELDVSLVREHAAGVLPEYMVPSAFVVLDELPLTVNGKVDRRALPAPDTEGGAEYVAPRSDKEQLLCRIWAEVLGVDRVGVQDDFFARGGDSITGLKVMLRVQKAVGCELSTRTVFDHPTVSAMAEAVARAQTPERAHASSQVTAIAPASRDGELPLSYGQERLWFLDDFAPGGVEYNTGLALRLAGHLDLAALRTALDGLTARHEALRTTFGGRVQTVESTVAVPLRVVDLCAKNDADRPHALDKVLRTEQSTPFDLATGPLFRVLAVRLGAREHVLVLSMHHIVTDGWSMGVITRELAALYAAAVRGEDAQLPELPVQYPDFAVWQRERLTGDAHARQLDYWREQLDGLQPLELPTDRPRPAVRTSAGALHTFQVPGELARRLARSGQRRGASLFVVLTAVTQLLLSRYSGQRDVAVGTVVSGRERAELEGLVGFFVNTLVLRARIDQDRHSFDDLLDHVRTTALDAFAHQEVPFDRVVDALAPERDPSRTPLVQALIVLQNSVDMEGDFAGLAARREPVPRESSRFDLTLEFWESPSGLTAELEFNTDLFDAETVERLCGHWLVLAERVVAEPSVPVVRVGMLGGAELERLLMGWAGPGVGVGERSVVELIQDRIAAAPGAVAVLGDRGVSLSYGELGARVDRLAGHLVRLGVGVESRVGVSLPRSVDLVVAALAVLRAGGAYVPLDPEYPADRLEFMKADSGVRVVVDEAMLAGPLSAGADAGAGADAREALSASGSVPLSSAAYVIYTSGSTGRPKGVVVPHAAMAGLVRWAVDLGEERFSRTLFSTSLNFDVSVFELFGTLAAGGTVEVVRDVLALTERDAWSGSLISAVPSAFAGVLGQESAVSAEMVVLAGEAFPAGLLEQTRRAMPGAVVANIYGPTEATVYATGWFSDTDADSEGPMVPIGRPVAGKATYVLDGGLSPAPVGVWGELYLGGGLARGYHGRSGLTSERFVADPFRSGGRLYRTGDVVRWRADGSLEYAGRGDDQVKIRGFRIELGEIESVLSSHPSVAQSVVVAREDRPGVKRLAAYLVGVGDSPLDVAVVREHVASALPEYMVPAAFVVLDALPLNANGKLDRRALPAPEFASADAAYVAPRTESERLLCGVWAEVLGLERVGIEDNFFDLGGDSIISLQVVSRARRAGLALSSRDVFLHPTLSTLATQAGQVDTGPALLTESGLVTGAVGTTPVREWFFDTHPVSPEHFNMGAGFTLSPATDLDALRAAVAALLAQHDALRSTFTRTPEGAWAGHITPAVDLDAVFAVHACGPEELPALVAAAHAGLDLERGPLVRVLVGVTDPEAPVRVVLAAHHLVVDGVSWRILLEDLESAYERIVTGREPGLGPKGTSVRQWAARLAEHTAAGGFDAQLPYWLETTARATTRLPVDRPGGDNTVDSERSVSVRLSAEETRELLQRVPAVYRTRPNDVLLSALVRAAGPWAGGARWAVDIEAHGREEIFDDTDLTRTVGWFTSIHPVVLDVPGDEGADWRGTIRAVKERLRAVPDQGVGYGALRHLRWPEGDMSAGGGAGLSTAPVPELAFNYLGHFGGADDADDGWYRSLVLNPGGEHHTAEQRSHVLEVVGAVQDGVLAFTWSYSANLHDRETVRSLAERFTAELRSLIAHCAEPDSGGCSPSDFPLVQLTQAEIDLIAGDGRDIEDVYPLTPLQAGMLFHSLNSPGSAAYLEQFTFVMDGVADLDALARAWQRVVDASDALRVSIAWEGLSEPVQIVHRRAEMPVARVDWTGRSEAERSALWAALVAEDRAAAGLDPGSAPLTRVTLARLPGDRVQVLWSFHHILLDGWSSAAVLSDVAVEYAALVSEGGAPGPVDGSVDRAVDGLVDRPLNGSADRPVDRAVRPVRGAFREHLRWLAGRDQEEGRAFWRSRLAGFEEPSALPFDRTPDSAHRARSTDRVTLRLPAATARAVVDFARRSRVTVGTMVHGAWALTLSQYAGSFDVVFGTTVSGRPADQPGAESTVGLFINTLPVRIAAMPAEPVTRWLRRIGDEQAEARQYEYVALHEITTDVPSGAALFDSLVVVENYPVDTDAAARHGIVLSGLDAVESTNYPLTLTARAGEGTAEETAQETAEETGEGFVLTFGYDPELFDADTVRRLAARCARALDELAEDGERAVGTLTLLGEDERARVLGEWSGAPATAADAAPVPSTGRPASATDVFRARVAASPDAAAVKFRDATLSYRQLEGRADRLAHALLKRGVGAGSRVGLLLARSPEVVVAMLAVLKAGAAYVPLHAAHPARRMRDVLERSGAELLLTDGSVRAPEGVAVLDMNDAGVGAEAPPAPVSAPEPESESESVCASADVSPETPAYVMFTSGSTGTPKGVVVTHGGVAALAADRRFDSAAHRQVLFHSPHSFDAATYEVWGPLLNGGCVVVADEELTAPAVRRAAERGVTAVFVTTALFGALADEDPGCFAGLREVWTGGEAASAPAMTRMRAHCPDTELVHVYGPTETTTFALCGPVAAGDVSGGPVPLGGPMDDTLAYVLDGALRPVGAGVPGELYLGGSGLARGYDGRAGLTAERFVASPFAAGGRLYRTGDVVRRRTDGRVEFLGRSDGQVKIRGFRIELGEIEALLTGRQDVGAVAVVAREDRPGTKRLVAYLVPAGGSALDMTSVREQLAAALPAYMVPSAFVELEALPLTVNGKVDRRALPAPGQGSWSGNEGQSGDEHPYVAPRPGAEEQLAGIWRTVLGTEQVGAHDDFFALGGDSISALKVVSRLRAALGAGLSPRALFDHPTVARLAAAVTSGEQASAAGSAPDGSGITPAPRDGRPLPLSYAQERLWFLDEFTPGGAEYNVVTALRLTGRLDLPALRSAVSGLVARHEALRTTFDSADGRGVQKVHSELDVTVRIAQAHGAAERDALLRAEAAAPFDLRTGPLLRALLVPEETSAPSSYLLMLTMHHIITDGWSMGVITRELSELYAAALRGGEADLPALPVQYPDYAVWQRERLTGAALDTHLEYWREHLRELPVLELPTDRPRPAVRTGRGALHTFRVPEELTAALTEAAGRRGATLSMALTAVTQLLLARYSGQNDLAVATAVSGRERTELEGLVGFFVNTLVLRSRIDASADFDALLTQVRETTLAAFAHQDVPFSRLVEELDPERDPSRTPLVQAAVTLQNAPRETFALPGLRVEETLPPVETAQFDLNIEFEPVPGGGLFAVVSYSTDLFDAGTVGRMVGHWLGLAGGLVVAGSGGVLGEVSMVGVAEREWVVGAGRGVVGVVSGGSVVEGFAVRVAESPGSVAVVCGDVSLTYGELDARAGRLARVLVGCGVGVESRVGLLLERSVDVVVAMLAVVRAGGAYVPLHGSYPGGRVREVLGRSGAVVVVTDRAVDEVGGVPVVRVDAEPVGDVRLPSVVPSGALAYVMFTSGSTGVPKGVAVTHGDIVALAADSRWSSGAHGRVLFHSPHSFDAATYEVWVPLLNGGTVDVAGAELSVSVVRDAVARGVSGLFLTKALFDVLAEEDAGCFAGLGEVWTGGEAASGVAMGRVLEACPGVELVHVYGPTESTTFAVCGPVEAEDVSGSAVPLGGPMDNTSAYVLDDGLRPVGVGVPGELYLGGGGLARGYDGRAGLTAERFVADPFGSGERLYRTGDVVRWGPDGRLAFLGRSDGQVKIRGFRIELGEIESVLSRHVSVGRVSVVVREDRPGAKRLVAYLVPSGDLDVTDVREHAAGLLPEYMVPSAFVVLDALPLTTNGKVDQRALPTPDLSMEGEYVAPRTDAERALCEVWADVLGRERVGVHDNFFSLGGDSISSLQVVSRARRAGLDLTSRDVFLRQNIADLAASATTAAPRSASLAPQGAVSGPVGPTPIRDWFFAHHPVAPHHFAMSMGFELAIGTDPAHLRSAVAALLAQHDALRSTFTPSTGAERAAHTRGWAGHIAPAVDVDAVFSVHDLTGADDAENVWQEKVLAAQSGMDLSRGPLFRVLVGDLGPTRPARLFIAAHHLLVDGVSWRILLEDLTTAYAQAAAGGPVRLGEKSASVQQWSERLAAHVAAGGFDDQAGYWRTVTDAEETELPVDLPGGGNTMAAQATVEVTLDAEETEALLHRVPDVYRTRTDDVLLAALARTLRTWTGRERTAVAVEGHGREELFGDLDLTRTVGWFTSIHPVALALPDGDDRAAALMSVKEQLRAVPDRGLGYGALRHLSADGSPGRVLRVLADAAEPCISFNYHGRFDGSPDTTGPLRAPLPAVGQDHHPAEERAHLIDVIGVVTAGRLTFTWTYSTEVHRPATIERLARDFASEISGFVRHCAQPDAGGRTPSDFPLVRLDQATVDALVGVGPAVRDSAVEDIYPLTPMQSGMLLHTLTEPGVYLDQVSFLLEGADDPALLATAWQRLVDATPALRTRLVWDGVPEPLQVVLRHATVAIRQLDWTGLEGAADPGVDADPVAGPGAAPGVDEHTSRLRELMDEEHAAGIDLTAAPLMRLVLIRVREGAVRVVWTFHHVVLDGWSTSQIFEDVFAQYRALGTGTGGAAPLAARPPFRDYVEWLSRQDTAAAREYWRGALAGFGSPTPLPVDRRPAPGHRPHAAERVRIELSTEDAGALTEMAGRHRLTLNSVVQGAWALLLSRYAGEADVCFGATVSGRPADLPGMESTVGNFLNTLPVRTRVPETESLLDWLGRLQTEQAEARSHEHLALREVRDCAELPRGTELFESIVVFENYPGNEEAAAAHGLRVTDVHAVDTAGYPLDLTAYVDADKLALVLAYDPALFDHDRIVHMAGHLAVLLRGMPGSTHRPPAELPLLSEDGRDRLLRGNGNGNGNGEGKGKGKGKSTGEGWSGRQIPYEHSSCLHELIAAQARSTPDAEAVVFGTSALTYAELDSRANRLAQYLVTRGVGPETVTAICLERAPDMVVALLAVLKAGGAYVPLDPAHPAERLAYVLTDSAARLVITQRSLVGGLPAGPAPLLPLDERWDLIAGLPDRTPETGVTPRDIAYVIYTSGSTGRPKGVMVEHRSISHGAASWNAAYGFTGGGEGRTGGGEGKTGGGERKTDGPVRQLNVASMSFDVFVSDLVHALCHGGALVIAPSEAIADPARLLTLMRTARVTHLDTVPALATALADEAARHGEGLPPLRVLAAGADLWRTDDCRRLLDEAAEGTTVLNTYGVTEATVESSLYPAVRGALPDTAGVPIGRPNPGILMYLLDSMLRPVPVGVTGDLYLGGPSVARGYLNRPELTAQRFVADPFGADPAERLYRTGDRARYLPDGAIEFAGRADEQMKIRGFRIEPGEIESALRQHPSVARAVVAARQDDGGAARLVGYAVVRDGHTFAPGELRAHLKGLLPGYMVPSVFMELTSLPLNANGKVDRRALPAPDPAAQADTAYLAPRTPGEDVLAGIWQEVLGVERVGVEDDFFDLGGNSIQILQINSRIRTAFGVGFSVRAFYDSPTVAGLAVAVEEHILQELEDSIRPEQPEQHQQPEEHQRPEQHERPE